MSFPFSFQGASSHYMPSMSSTWYRYEAARSFDLDDDLEFCPGLLSEDEVNFINVAYSDRSSSTSGSPNSSPLQMQIQPSSSAGSPYSSQTSTPNSLFNTNVKHLTSTSRQRNAIPIVNPTTGMRVSSPPLSSSGVPRPTNAQSVQLPRRHW